MILLALLSGALTVLSPCVLPLLPIVLACALSEHRYAPLALIGGLVVAFTLSGLAVAGAVQAFGIEPESLRAASAGLLLLFGAMLLSSGLRARIASWAGHAAKPIASRAARFRPRGVPGYFVLGALLGAAWTPCAGPTLGAAISLAASGATALRGAATMAMFAVGAALPLIGLAYGSRQSIAVRRALLGKTANIAQPVLGAALALLAALMLLGADRVLEAKLVNILPEWLLRLTTRF